MFGPSTNGALISFCSSNDEGKYEILRKLASLWEWDPLRGTNFANKLNLLLVVIIHQYEEFDCIKMLQ